MGVCKGDCERGNHIRIVKRWQGVKTLPLFFRQYSLLNEVVDKSDNDVV